MFNSDFLSLVVVWLPAHIVLVLIPRSSIGFRLRFPFDLLLSSQSVSSQLIASLTSRHSGSLDFAFFARLVGLIFNLSIVIVCPALFYSGSCHSPIVVLNAPKCCFGSGFVRQTTMFTLVSKTFAFKSGRIAHSIIRFLL